MERFLDYIGKNYDKLKKQLQSYKDFDEDVFHNTIIKCQETIENNGLNFKMENDVIRYFIGAYRTNLLRQKMYYYEKNIYLEHVLEGISIANLQLKYKIKNLKQKLKDIKTYISNKYTDRTHDEGY